MFKKLEFHLTALRIHGYPIRTEWDVLCAALLLVLVMILSAVYGNDESSERDSLGDIFPGPVTQEVPLQVINQIGLFLPSEKMSSESKNPWLKNLVSEDDPSIKLAPPTSLPLKLTGIIYNSDATKRLAIFEQAGGQITQMEGTNLQDQPAEIRKIFPDVVIILSRGEYASIRLSTPN